MDDDNLASVRAMLANQKVSKNLVIKPLLSYSQVTNDINVPDPYYGGEKGFEKVLDLLEDACDALLLELNETE